MAGFVAPQNIEPVSKDVLYMEMLWIVQGKRKTETGTCFRATRNRSQQESRHKGYLCNDWHKSQSRQILRNLSKSSILSPERRNVRELSTETRNHKTLVQETAPNWAFPYHACSTILVKSLLNAAKSR